MFRSQIVVALLSLAASFFSVVDAQNSNGNATLVISNDDGWATAQIRAQFEALSDANYDVGIRCCLNVRMTLLTPIYHEGHPIRPGSESVGQGVTNHDARGAHHAMSV